MSILKPDARPAGEYAMTSASRDVHRLKSDGPTTLDPWFVGFKLLSQGLGKPVLVDRSDRHPEFQPVALLWPFSLDWHANVACLNLPYPTYGEALEAGTHLQFNRCGDPEFGDFWSIRDGPLADSAASFSCGASSSFPRGRGWLPQEWGVVAIDEPLLSRPDEARRLYDSLVACWRPEARGGQAKSGGNQ